MIHVTSALLVLLLVASSASASVVAPTPVVDDARKSAQQAALAAAYGMRDQLALGDSTLVVGAVHPTANGGHIVRLAQQVAGFPVEDAVVTVRLDSKNHVLRVSSSAIDVMLEDATPRLPGAQALEIARSAVQLPVPSTPSGYGHLLVTRAGHLAWRVQVTVAMPVAAPVVVVDARTGDVLSVRNAARYAGRKANVFASGAAAKAARQADGSFSADATVEVPLEHVDATLEGDNLYNSRLIGLNCCPNAECDGESAPVMHDGSFPLGQGIAVNFEAAMCDERPLAIADSDGNFLASPAREPASANAPVPGPSEQNDVFSEINAFHHASNALAYIESLDATFQLPPDARPLHVTTNFLLPDFNEIMQGDLNALYQKVLRGEKVVVDKLARMDNAMYFPKGAGEQLGVVVPGYTRDADSIIFFQGNTADFGYDPAVIVHELGHGVVAATAQLADYSTDEQGIIDAPGAMNEGFADYWAAAHFNNPRIGEYVGDLSGSGEGSLRNLENDFSCPSVIWGEVHQDSQHFSAALWAARKDVAGNEAQKRIDFDRAVLAAMRALTPTSSFEEAVEALALELNEALNPAAKAALEARMSERRVTGCERIVDLTSEKSLSNIFFAPADESRGWKPFAPGPLQFRLQAPRGTNRIAVTVEGSAGDMGGLGLPGMGGGQSTPKPIALLKADAQVAFTYDAQVGHDAQAEKTFGSDGSVVFGGADGVSAGCEEKTFFLALGSTESGSLRLSDLSVSFNVDATAVEACDVVDVEDDDPEPTDTDGAGSGGDVPEGCGCTSGGQLLGSLVGLLFFLRRRRC